MTTALVSSSAVYTLPEISSLLILSGIACYNLSPHGRLVGIQDDPEMIFILGLRFRMGGNSLRISLGNSTANSRTALNRFCSSAALTASSSTQARMDIAAVARAVFLSVTRFPGHMLTENLSMLGGWIVTGAGPAEIVGRTS